MLTDPIASKPMADAMKKNRLTVALKHVGYHAGPIARLSPCISPMHYAQQPYRSLYVALHECEGESVFLDVLTPWLKAYPGEPEWLRQFRGRAESHVPEASQEDLWRLYALSRVCELLALRFQQGSADGSDWRGPSISTGEFEQFAEQLGLESRRPIRYSSFHHEIVELISLTEPAAPVRIETLHWPCLMLGPLLMMRAGTTVAAGCEAMRPDVADQSTLYWAYRRKNRPSQDLSHGWGTQSAWRTEFRRDYQFGDMLHFNVDAKQDLSKLRTTEVDEYGLSAAQRLELLTNRCFVVTQKNGADFWPYDDRVSLRVEPESTASSATPVRP